MRKFEIVSKYTDKNINLPTRATESSAGYDIEVAEDTVINPVMQGGGAVMVPTGIKAEFPKDEALLLYPRSSNPGKLGLIMPNGVGVVDADYYNNPNNEGEIKGLFINITDKPVILKKGYRIMQGIFTKYQVTDNDSAQGKRVDGFGSTNKKI